MSQVIPHFIFFSGSSYPWQEEIKTAGDFQTRNGILERRGFAIRSLYEQCQESGNMKTQTSFALFPLLPSVHGPIYLIFEERLAMAFRPFLFKYEKSFSPTAEIYMNKLILLSNKEQNDCSLFKREITVNRT